MLRFVASICGLLLLGGLVAGCASAPPGPSCAGTGVGNIIAADFAPYGQGNVNHAEYIAWRESRCDPGAYNPSGASGVFQLLGHQDLVRAACPLYPDVFDPNCNTLAAVYLFQSSGWQPWGG